MEQGPLAQAQHQDKTPVYGLRAVSKNYPGVQALKDVTLEFLPGEVHAIVGENGAGKSTLIKALAGAITPSAGEVVIGEVGYNTMTPSKAQEAGIAVIYQEFTLVTTLNAADNVFLGQYLTKRGVLDRAKMLVESRKLFRRLGVSIDPRQQVENLTTGYQQIVEIAKALARDARILIMDEPSAPLTATEVEAMFSVIDTLRAQGITIVYISHRMEEVFHLADRVTVIRDGRHIKTVAIDETNSKELISLMVGRELAQGYPHRDVKPGQVTLEVEKLTGNGVEEVSFHAREGEILGFAGLIGAGRTELMELLYASEKIESGTVRLRGDVLRLGGPRAAIKAGLALVPEDRKRHGLILNSAVRENISLPILKKLSRFGVVSKPKEEKLASDAIEKLSIRTPSDRQQVANLSGGNQQKVVLAKALATEAELIILDEPTRGIDVGAKREIYELINKLAAAGKTILVVSSEMEELIGISDRIIVLKDGRVAGELTEESITQEKIMELAAEGMAA